MFSCGNADAAGNTESADPTPDGIGWRGLERTDVAPSSERARDATLVGGRTSAISCVDGRAARQQWHGRCGTAVMSKRTEHRIGGVEASRPGKVAARVRGNVVSSRD